MFGMFVDQPKNVLDRFQAIRMNIKNLNHEALGGGEGGTKKEKEIMYVFR